MKVFAFLLFIFIFIPLETIFGEIKGFKWTITPYYWVLLISSTLLSAWLLNGLIPEKTEKFIKILEKLLLLISKYFNFLAPSILLVLLFSINIICFSSTPLLIDSIVQLFQAEIFSQGLIKAARPQYLEFFVTQHMIFDDSGWYGQYPPGHSMLLLPFVIAKIPWVANIIVTLLNFYLIVSITEKVFNKNISKISGFLLLICPFFFFMGASHMNHPSALLCISLFIYFFILYEQQNKSRYLFYSGLACGYCILIRPLDAIIVLLALLLPLARILLKKYKDIFVFCGGALPFFITSMLYNKLTTGDYFLPGYIKLWGKGHGLGFHTSPWGNDHTPITGLRNELADMQILQEMLFDWPLPSLIFVSLYLFFLYNSKETLNLWIKRFLIIAVLYPAIYFFYWHRDAFLGPRFMYGSIVAWVPLTAFSLFNILEAYKFKQLRLFKILKSFTISNYIKTCLIISVAYFLLFSFPERWEIYRTSLSSMKLNLVNKAKEQNINSGLIFVKSSWGVRIMSQLRGLGLSASETQIAYTNLDHCKLHLLILEAIKNQYSKEILQDKINDLLNKKEKTLSYKVNFDPSLKLSSPLVLHPLCKDELLYDLKNQEQDYTLYEPHIRVNSARLDRNFIVAKDLRERNSILRNIYPSLDSYIFNGSTFTKIQ